MISLDEAHEAIQLADAVVTHDEQIARLVTTISRRMDFLCGPIVQRTITDELHQNPDGSLYLRHAPVVSITNVKEWSSGTATALTAETHEAAGGYYFDVGAGTIARRSSWYDTSWSSSYVTITYVAGRYVDTDSVDARFKGVAQMAFNRLWDRESGAWSRTPDAFEEFAGATPSRFFHAVDPVVKELLSDEMTLEGHGVVIA